MVSRRSILAGAGATAAFGLAGIGSGVKSAKASVDTDVPPKAQGFRFPHESEPHERTFMQWPANLDLYGGRGLGRVQSAIARLARTIAEFEPVTMLAAGEHHGAIKRATRSMVELMDVPTDDLWARDSGPLFLASTQNGLAIADLNFNGWGEKQVHENDALVAETVAGELGIPRFNTGLVGEGGGIEQDGEGTLIAHASSWINENRNPFSGVQVDTLLRETMAADQVIWSDGVKDLDITDYHIDTLARFIEPGKVLMQLPRSRETNDPFEKAAWATHDHLNDVRDAKGRKLEILTLHGPNDPRDTSSDFVSSYVNYYVCNDAVILAEFGDDAADDVAKSVIANLHPGRKVVTLNVDALARNGGGIHCATREMPKI